MICGYVSTAQTWPGDAVRFLSAGRISPNGVPEDLATFQKENMAVVATAAPDSMAESGDSRYVCVVDGAIFNCADLLHALRRKGSHPAAGGPADIVLACHLGREHELLKTIRGHYVFAVLDTVEQTIAVCRDMYGGKLLYYANTPHGFVFSSDLAMLARTSWIKKEISPEGLARYMAGGYITAPHTIYKGIFALHPGEVAQFRKGSCEASRFHSFPPDRWTLQDVSGTTEDDLVDKFDALLADSIAVRLPTTRETAVYLSGGHDTSLLCGSLSRHTDKDIVAYTLGLNNSPNDESVYAQKVARHLNLQHHLYHLKKEDFFDTIGLIPDIYGQPLADISAILTCVITRIVAERHDCVFCGDGPDFMFGNFDFKLLYYYYKYVPRRLYRGMSLLSEFVIQTFFKEWISPNLSVPELLRQSELFWIFQKKFKDRALANLLSGRVSFETFESYKFLTGRTDIPPSERLLLTEHMFYGMDDVLFKATASHNHHSLSLLRPYYDQNLFEFIRHLPKKYKFRKGRGRYLQNRLLHRYIPAALINRPKRGFIVDFVEFGAADLRAVCEKRLTRAKLSETGLINADFAVRCVEEYFGGNTTMGPKLWTLLMFEVWRERFSL